MLDANEPGSSRLSFPGQELRFLLLYHTNGVNQSCLHVEAAMSLELLIFIIIFCCYTTTLKIRFVRIGRRSVMALVVV